MEMPAVFKYKIEGAKLYLVKVLLVFSLPFIFLNAIKGGLSFNGNLNIAYVLFSPLFVLLSYASKFFGFALPYIADVNAALFGSGKDDSALGFMLGFLFVGLPLWIVLGIYGLAVARKELGSGKTWTRAVAIFFLACGIVSILIPLAAGSLALVNAKPGDNL
jgi:hypothetical protein